PRRQARQASPSKLGGLGVLAINIFFAFVAPRCTSVSSPGPLFPGFSLPPAASYRAGTQSTAPEIDKNLFSTWRPSDVLAVHFSRATRARPRALVRGKRGGPRARAYTGASVAPAWRAPV